VYETLVNENMKSLKEILEMLDAGKIDSQYNKLLSIYQRTIQRFHSPLFTKREGVPIETLLEVESTALQAVDLIRESMLEHQKILQESLKGTFGNFSYLWISPDGTRHNIPAENAEWGYLFKDVASNATVNIPRGADKYILEADGVRYVFSVRETEDSATIVPLQQRFTKDVSFSGGYVKSPLLGEYPPGQGGDDLKGLEVRLDEGDKNYFIGFEKIKVHITYDVGEGSRTGFINYISAQDFIEHGIVFPLPLQPEERKRMTDTANITLEGMFKSTTIEKDKEEKIENHSFPLGSYDVSLPPRP
jgi:hypothetical protein